MNEQPRQKLREIVERHGRAVVEDVRRCEGLLRDYSGEHRREVSVLVSALEERIPQDMLAAPAGTPREVLLARMARRLSEDRALSDPAAAWSVNSWALALGLVSDDELKAFGGRSTKGPENDPRHGVHKEGSGAGPSGQSPNKAWASAPAASAPAGAASVVVSASGGGDYASIAEALGSVAPGGRIIVRPGTYEESIVLDKQVEIVGDGPPGEIVVRGAGASCLKSSAERARVSGVTIRGASGGVAAFFAVDVSRGELVLEDCEVSSDTLSCVAVHGPGASALISGCRIHDGADSGLYFFDGAAGTVEGCEVYRNANVGVAITGGARAVVRRGKVYGGGNAGVVAWQGGTGLLEECEVYGNRLANLGVSEGAKLTARACRVHGGENSGVFVHHEGEAVMEGCELYGHREAEAAVTTQGRLFLNGCGLRHGRASGVFIRDGGQALLQRCVVSDNGGAGLSVGGQSALSVLASHVNGNARHAVEVSAGGTARVEDSDLTGNGLGPWDVEYGAEVESERNRD